MSGKVIAYVYLTLSVDFFIFVYYFILRMSVLLSHTLLQSFFFCVDKIGGKNKMAVLYHYFKL